MSTLQMGDFLAEHYSKEEKQRIEENKQAEENFFNLSDDVSVDDGYYEWRKSIDESDHPQELILKKLKETLSEDDGKCIDKILEVLNSTEDKSKLPDLLGIEEILKKDYPDITPLAVLQYVLLLMNIGLIKTQE